MAHRKILIIGAGIVGTGLADELAQLGETDITVVDKGPLGATGGSTFHAPGLVSRTSTSKFLTDTADITIRKFGQLTTEDGPAMPGLGTLEVAYDEARLAELWRRRSAALAYGWKGRIVSPDEALERWPILEPNGLLGGYATDDEGLAAATRAVVAMTSRAETAGVRFIGDTEVTRFVASGARVAGVETTAGTIDADLIVCCAGVWGPALAQMSDLTVPIAAMEHQYAVTAPIPQLAANAAAWATMPILRHHDGGLYFRDHGDRVGIGSFHHRAMPVASEGLDSHQRNLESSLAFAFTEPEWEDAWRIACDLMRPLRDAGLERRFNGVFGFTPDGYPVVGEHPLLDGLWFALSVWITHSQGVARGLAQTLVTGGSDLDMSPADLSRFDPLELDPAFIQARSADQYTDVYLAHHPAEPHASARNIRTSPFAGAFAHLHPQLVDVATWERPQWFDANAPLLDGATTPRRDGWSAAHWSPIALAEHLATRDRAGLFDMSPLYRLEVAGPGARDLLARTVAGRTDGSIGSVAYSVMLDERGGIRSDVTVTRLADETFWLCGNGPRDLGWLRRHAREANVPDVIVRPVAAELACAGLWGPAAREILSSIVETDLSNDAFPYLTSQPISVADIEAIATRISYAGELGWELTCAAEDGATMWQRLMEAGREHGLAAAGRAALGTLRLEKGYRAWGSDLTPEHTPDESGIGFTVRRDDGGDFIGKAGLAAREPSRKALRCLVIDDDQVTMGAEAVLAGGDPVGYVTSAGYGASVRASIAYAWLDASIERHEALTVVYFDRELPARITDEPFFDPTNERLRS